MVVYALYAAFPVVKVQVCNHAVSDQRRLSVSADASEIGHVDRLEAMDCWSRWIVLPASSSYLVVQSEASSDRGTCYATGASLRWRYRLTYEDNGAGWSCER